MEKTLLKVENLKVTLFGKRVLDDLSFEVKKGETLAVIGPNGAGKTVLFKALLGLIQYEGKITWNVGIKIGYVPQRFSIESELPLTVSEFLNLKKTSKGEIERILEEVGIPEDNILKQKLGVLSGGQLQRVLIAWALLDNPDVLLFDEPTTGIDISGEETIYSFLHKLQEKKGLTVILISHELQVVYRWATTVFCLNREKVCFGPPLEVLDKESLRKLFGEDVGFYHHHPI